MLILFIFQYVLLNHKVSPIVVLPFKISGINPSNQNYSINSFINDLFYVDLYTTLYIGTPPQEVLTLIRPDNKTLFLNSKDCQRKKLKYIKDNSNITKGKTFNNKDSSTFKKKTTMTNSYFNSKDFIYLVSETLTFYNSSNLNNWNNLDNIIKFDDFDITLEKNYNNKLCCRLGIGYQTNPPLHIIFQLKMKKIINNYLMTIKYNDEDSGILTFGNSNNSSNLVKVYTGTKGNIILPWSIRFNKIYFMAKDNKEILVQSYSLAYLVFNFGLIKGPEKYKNFILNNYFQELINQNICKMEITEKTSFDRKATPINNNGTFTIFTCDKEIFKKNYIQKFPSLKLKQDGFNFIFELTYKDLFKEINNKYYFLVIFPGDESSVWILGIPFLKKYEFVYDYDSDTIGFYTNFKENIKRNKLNKTKNIEMDNSNDKNFVKIFLGIIIIIFCAALLIIFTLFIAKKIFVHRKKRANELEDDDYEYFSEINNEKKDDKKSSLIGQNYITSKNISNK